MLESKRQSDLNYIPFSEKRWEAKSLQQPRPAEAKAYLEDKAHFSG